MKQVNGIDLSVLIVLNLIFSIKYAHANLSFVFSINLLIVLRGVCKWLHWRILWLSTGCLKEVSTKGDCKASSR